MTRAVLFYVDRSRILRMLWRQPRDARAPLRPLRRCDHRTVEYFTIRVTVLLLASVGFSVFRCYELILFLGV